MKPEEVPRYSLSEIVHASGVVRQTMESRRKRLGINPVNGYYSMNQAKELIKRRRVRAKKCRKALEEELRRKLKNDGCI